MPFPAASTLAVATGGWAFEWDKPNVESVGSMGWGAFGPNVNWTLRVPQQASVEVRQAFQDANRLITVMRDRIVRLGAEFSRTNRRALGEP